MTATLFAATMLLVPHAIALNTAKPSAEDAIRGIVNRQAAAWNSNDAAAWAADYTEDATFINVRGDVVRGREQVEKIHAFIFRGPYLGSHIDLAVDTITYAAPTVAIVDTTATVTNFKALPPGLVTTRPGALVTRLKYILVERDKQWQILSAQNTTVSPAPMEVK